MVDILFKQTIKKHDTKNVVYIIYNICIMFCFGSIKIHDTKNVVYNIYNYNNHNNIVVKTTVI